MIFDNKLVSIITPAFNSAKYIQEAYDSIKAQSYIDWEWVITDDCSEDDTWDILCSISQSDERVKVYRNDKNLGASETRNNSLKRSMGRFVAFLDSDDLWMKEKLAAQINYMIDNNYAFCFTAYAQTSCDGHNIHKVIDKNKSIQFITYHDLLLKKVTLGCSTVILDRKYLGEVFMPNLRTGQDYATWLNILRPGNKAFLYDEVLTKYRIMPNSISRNKVKKACRQWEIYRKIEKIKFIQASWYFLNYAIRAVSR